MNNSDNLQTETMPLAKDIVYTANESRFSAAHYSEALTAFSSGYKDPENLSDILEFIAPTIPVSRRFEFKKANNSEAFLSEMDDIRSIGSSFKCVEYTGHTVNERTYNKGLTIRVDHDEIANDDWQERYVQLLIQRLYRNELRRAINALNDASSAHSQIWSAQSNPDAHLRKALSTAANSSGIRPNRLLFGELAWDLRASAFEAKESISSIRSADMSPKDLASKLLIDEIKIIRARYQGDQDRKAQIVGNSVYAYFAQNTITKDEPSNLKRFITPVDGGGNFRVYLEEDAKFTSISVEHYSNIVITSTLGIQKINILEKQIN